MYVDGHVSKWMDALIPTAPFRLCAVVYRHEMFIGEGFFLPLSHWHNDVIAGWAVGRMLRVGASRVVMFVICLLYVLNVNVFFFIGGEGNKRGACFLNKHRVKP